MKYLSLLLIPITVLFLPSKTSITGEELLHKSLQYHDPSNVWNTKAFELHIEESRPKQVKPDEVTLSIDNPMEFFKYFTKNDSTSRMYKLKKDTCELAYNGSNIISEEIAKEFKMNCKFSKVIRNYYTYLWGLPMKLKDPGTILHKEVKEETFQGEDCYKLKVTYEKTVGSDIWYFYFKKENYALHGYKFHRDEAKNDGEYITLEGEEAIANMKLPKTRKWYYNKDDKFLGEDKLVVK